MQTETGVISHNVSRKRYLESLKLMTMFQKKKSRQYLTVILTFTALTIFSVFAINPTITTIVQLQKQLEDSKAYDQQLDEKITSIQTLQREYEALQQHLPLLSSAIPTSPEAPKLIGQIRSLSTQHNLSVDEIQMGSVPYSKDSIVKGTATSFPLEFTVKGNYTDIKAFVTEATTFDRIILLDKVVISRKVDDRLLDSSATMRAYFDQLSL